MPDPANHTFKMVFGSSAGTGENAGGDFSFPGESQLMNAVGATTSMTLGDIYGDIGELAIEAPKDVTSASGKQAE